MEVFAAADVRVNRMLGDPQLVVSLLDALDCLVVLMDREGRILHWNRACERLSGWTLAEARGRLVWDVVFPSEDRDSVREFCLAVREGWGGCCFENRWVGRDGAPVHLAWSNSCLGEDCIVGTGIDVTGLLRAEEDARQAHRRVQEVLERLLLAQEEERRRVAYEVHDGLLQYVIAARLHLETLEKRLQACCPMEVAALAHVRERIAEALTEGRRIIAALRPSTLDDYGLEETLRRDLSALRRETGWTVTFRSTLRDTLPPPLETTLYRIFQEAVHNAHRHSKTRRLLVELEEGRGEVLLRVRDWGRGFRRARHGGFGLKTLRERAELVGGRCSIDSVPEEGTTVEVAVPRPEMGDGR